LPIYFINGDKNLYVRHANLYTNFCFNEFLLTQYSTRCPITKITLQKWGLLSSNFKNSNMNKNKQCKPDIYPRDVKIKITREYLD
jgi:hypothetical protein